MKPKFEHYEELLRRKADDIQHSVSAQTVSQMVSRRDRPSDEGDMSQQSHEEWIFLNRNTLDMKLLREVKEALHRIEEGTYGVCRECEEPISAKRLEAVPWAKYCIKCQEEIATRAAEGREDYQEADR